MGSFADVAWMRLKPDVAPGLGVLSKELSLGRSTSVRRRELGHTLASTASISLPPRPAPLQVINSPVATPGCGYRRVDHRMSGSDGTAVRRPPASRPQLCPQGRREPASSYGR